MSPAKRLPAAIALMGPTAAGKSAAALELAARFPIEIVSVDSAQVFRGMDIGTAKPPPGDRASVPHHLIDIIDPTESYSAAQFVTGAIALVRDIQSRGRIPVLVGGTMLYFKALREGLSDLPEADPSVRAEIEAQAAERGWPGMHAKLAQVDPQTAARLQPSDAQRIQRALEVFRLTGRPMSNLLATRDERPAPFPLMQAALVPSDRSVLHRRIEARFGDMLRSGLVEELAGLRQRHALGAKMPSMRCVGYRQAWQFLDGEFGVDELRNRAVFATRQLAKRQLTWLRATQDVFTIDCLANDAMRQVRIWAERRLSGA